MKNKLFLNLVMVIGVLFHSSISIAQQTPATERVAPQTILNTTLLYSDGSSADRNGRLQVLSSEGLVRAEIFVGSTRLGRPIGRGGARSQQLFETIQMQVVQFNGIPDGSAVICSLRLMSQLSVINPGNASPLYYGPVRWSAEQIRSESNLGKTLFIVSSQDYELYLDSTLRLDTLECRTIPDSSPSY